MFANWIRRIEATDSARDLAELASEIAKHEHWPNPHLLYSYWKQYRPHRIMILSSNPNLNESNQETGLSWLNKGYCAPLDDANGNPHIERQLLKVADILAIPLRQIPISVLAPWRTRSEDDLTTEQVQMGLHFCLRLIHFVEPEILIVHGNKLDPSNRRTPPNPYAQLLAHVSAQNEYIEHHKTVSYPGKISLRAAQVQLLGQQRLLIGLPHLGRGRSALLFTEGLPGKL